MKEEPEKDRKKFHYLCKKMDNIYHEMALNSHLSDSAFAILYTIVELGGGCIQIEIARQFSLSRQTVNTSVWNLKEKGYLEIKKEEGRGKCLYLTLAGKLLAEEKILPILRLEKHIFDEMDRRDRSELLRLTEKYVEEFYEKAVKIL